MGAFAMAIVAVLLFFFGIVVGVAIGGELAKRCVTKKEYWLANVAIFVVGVLLSAIVWGTGWLLLAGLVIGCMAGAVAGLKMDFGESVGPWKFHDRYFRVNKDQLRRSENGNAEAVRRARRDNTPEPEVISVMSDAKDAAPSNGKRKK